MPRHGPNPKQFAQPNASGGEDIRAIDPTGLGAKASPRYVARELYLPLASFGNASNENLVSGDTIFPDLSGDFEALDELASAANSQRLDVAYQGRLAAGETMIRRITISIRGDLGPHTNPPQYRIAVYAEGAATANPVYDSGLLDANDILTETTILEGSISEHPIGSKRYFVIIEAHMDAGQTIQCSRPFVRQG